MILSIIVKTFVLAIAAAAVITVCIAWLNHDLSESITKNYAEGYKLPEDFVRAARESSKVAPRTSALEQRQSALDKERAEESAETPPSEVDNDEPQAANY